MIRRVFLMLVISALVWAITGGCSRKPEARIQVVATTTMMESAIRGVGKGRVGVTVLIPPGGCPGHYDIRPGDLRDINNSSALFIHGYEQFVPRLLAAAGKPGPRVCKAAVEGNWMLPDVYAEACREVSDLLSGIDPGNGKEYLRGYASLKDLTVTVSGELLLKIKNSGIQGMPVIGSDQQSAMLKWMGLDVVGTYGRSEEFTPGQLHDLAEVGRRRNVRLVVDNMQSGPAAGRELATEIGASHLTLSNFPGGFSDTSTWETCLRKNVDMVLARLSGAQK